MLWFGGREAESREQNTHEGRPLADLSTGHGVGGV